MAITKEQKQQQVAELIDNLAKSKLTVVADYSGLSVGQMQQLRQDLLSQNGSLKVIKKTLIKRALSQSPGLSAIKGTKFDGPIALAFGFTDEVTAPQVLYRFAKTNPNLAILTGFNQEGTLLSAEQIQQLAILPGMQELRGILTGVIAAPIKGLVGVLNGTLLGVVNVLNNLNKQKSAA